MVRWNPDQERAIYTKNKNILISASAGAGKTSVLIARLMHLIEEEKVPVERILAMTFSEAAANEMKKRLASSIHQRMEEVDDTQFLKQQLAALNSAHISTIHGFCLSVIKEYYYVIQLDKTRILNPMSDQQTQYIRSIAMEETMHYAYQQNGFYQLSQKFTSRIESNGSLEEEIISLATLANSKADPELFLHQCIKKTGEIDSLKELPIVVYETFISFFSVQIKLLLTLVKNAINEMEEDDLIEKYNFYKDAELLIERNEYEAFRSSFLDGIRIKLPSDTKCSYSKEIADKEKYVLSYLYEEETFVSFHNSLVEDQTLMINLVIYYLHAYERLKREQQVIDFDDMEHYAIQILKASDGYVAKQYQKQFQTIMVDEFQDSNDVQDELVRLICKEDNVFRVGDIKQSIYGFRHALPAIMKGLMEYQTEQDELIFLRNNYRSSKMIVDFNNQLFSTLMNVEGIDSSYLTEDNVEIGVAQQETYKTPVMMHLIDKKEVDPNKEYTSTELKASYLAYQIQTLRKKGYRYKDIVVLVRSNAKMVDIKRELDALNIPCFYSNKQGFYESKSVSTIIAFVRALINPHDDLNFISVLTSSLFHLHVNDLAKIRLRKKDGESFYSAIHGELFLHEFETLYRQRKELKLSEIIEKIYNINQYYQMYVNQQERSNLDLLYDMVCTYEANTAMSLQGFLRYLDKQKSLEVGEAMPIGMNDDVIRIMSIHRSKGLQFKVVLLYSSSLFSSKDSGGVLSMDETLGVGMKYYDASTRTMYPTAMTIAMKQKKLNAYLEEELRLLYVATTRAQEELHIIDIGEKKVVPVYDLNEFFKLQGYTNWIRKAFANTITPLFEYCYVNESWVTEKEPLQIEEYKQSVYTYDIHKSDILSPSDTEMHIVRPAPFTLDFDQGFERGTMLHKMVELLPHETWNIKLIEDIANRNGFTLTRHDISVLLRLNETTVFQKCLQMAQVYHEYPFMVKKDSDIMHGYMDFVAVGDGTVVMIDFKSDRGVSMEVLRTRYQDQIRAYRYALSKLYPQNNIDTFIYSFEMEAFLSIDGNFED